MSSSYVFNLLQKSSVNHVFSIVFETYLNCPRKVQLLTSLNSIFCHGNTKYYEILIIGSNLQQFKQYHSTKRCYKWEHAREEILADNYDFSKMES